MRKSLSLFFCCLTAVLVAACGGIYKTATVTGRASHISCCSAEITGKVKLPNTTAIDLSFGVLYSTNSGVLLGSAILIQAKSFDSDYSFTVHIDALEPGTTYYYRSFVSQNNEITYGDTKSFTTKQVPEGAVDMGLSVLWHQRNIGASKPEEYGDYYAWGETTTKSTYDETTYKWWNDSEQTLTKYCNNSTYGTMDHKTVLDPEDDVAHVKLGGNWRMPTAAEWDELINTENCTWTWTTLNRVNGYTVTSKKTGNSIFLPAAGYRGGGYLYDAGSDGYYWPSSLYADYSYRAWNVSFYSSDVYRGSVSLRYGGLSVRPVSEY